MDLRNAKQPIAGIRLESFRNCCTLFESRSLGRTADKPCLSKAFIYHMGSGIRMSSAASKLLLLPFRTLNRL